MDKVMQKKTGLHIENRWIIITIFIIHCSLFISPTRAQTFTQRIQKTTVGEGKVTVTHSQDIDDLVNGNQAADDKTAETTADDKTKTAHEKTSRAQRDSIIASHTTTTSDTLQGPPDTRKKVMRGGYKVWGYRVQVFAGGNQRKDRQKAQQTGNSIKAAFPDQPVYVHFYSPRWICRMGNYRTYEEAYQMLSSVKKMGFNAATIIKEKITVYN